MRDGIRSSRNSAAGLPGRVGTEGLRSSFIICTKDRPQDLARCLDSILHQTVLPGEVIIVDASAPMPHGTVPPLFEAAAIRMVHIRSTPGVPSQRNLGVRRARGDLIFFVDDDVILSPHYHEAILQVYQQKADEPVGGVAGTVVNRRRHSRAATLFRSVFLLNRGVEEGEGRMMASGNFAWVVSPRDVVQVEVLPGNNMSYRRRVFDEFRFDESLDGYALKEDADFSYRVSRRYPLYQTPFARLEHRKSELARDTIRAVSEMRIVNSYHLFNKNIPQTWANRLVFSWSLCGRLIYSVYLSIADRTTDHLTGTLAGIRGLLWSPHKPDRPPDRQKSDQPT